MHALTGSFSTFKMSENGMLLKVVVCCTGMHAIVPNGFQHVTVQKHQTEMKRKPLYKQVSY